MACLKEYRKSRSEPIGSHDADRDLQVPSSVDLLRRSLVRSIRERAYENQGFLERKFDGSDTRPAQHCAPKYSVIEVSSTHSLEDAESDLSDSERRDAANERRAQLTDQSNSPDRKFADGNTSDEFENSFGVNSSILSSDNEDALNDGWLVIGDKKDDAKNPKSTEMNNFILAQRKFNNSIFQDCSTYDITCPNVRVNEVHDKCLIISDSQNHSAHIHPPSQTDSISICSKEDCSPFCSNENNSTTKSSSTKVNEHADDHTVLCDTFFTHVVGGEQSTPNALSQSERSGTDGRSSLVERDLNSVESTQREVVNDGEKSALPAKRKFSRRHRKRSRRKANKSKKSYVYECSKCGVSYCIPTKAMNNVACCLHCDLWTPVEPEFVKREKTTWNTCRIS